MSFVMRKPHHTRANSMLRAWGEYKRLEWSVPNGLQRPSFFKHYLYGAGDMAAYADEQVLRMVSLLGDYKEGEPKKYRYVDLVYVQQRAIEDMERTDMDRCYYALRHVREYVFVNMWPEVIEVEARLADENKLNTRVYDWERSLNVTTGKGESARLVERVVVYKN